MATTKRAYVFITFVLSCVALVQIIVAFSTEMWISSDLSPIVLYAPGNMNAGVFKGTVTKGSNSYALTIVCDFGKNVCMWSCMTSAKGREEDLKYILDGYSVGSCSKNPTPGNETDTVEDGALMNSGAWVSAVLFLAFSLVATSGAALLGVLNTASNPTKTWLAIDSLFFWNGAAALFDIIALILLGLIFGSTLKDHVSVDTVITGVHSSSASLGWSYWMLVDPPLLHLINVGLLVYRDWSIAREPPPPVYDPEKEKTDGTIFLY